MKYKGLNDNQITVEAGISNGLIGKARKRGSLSQDNISKILYTYNDLNGHWWLTGIGEMIIKPNDYKQPKESYQVAEANELYSKFNILKELFGNDKKLDTIIDMLGNRLESIEDKLDKMAILTEVDQEIQKETKG